MKRMNLILLHLLLIPFLFISCITVEDSSLGGGEIPSAGNGNSTEKAFPASGWAFETEITNEGSRSEGSVSRLFYRYNELPPAFSRLIICQHVFTYVPMVNIWDDSGWIYSGIDSSSAGTQISGTINRSELKNGWYQADRQTRKSGTPGDWIFAESEIINVWVSPENIINVIELFSLEIRTGPELLLQAGTD
jgi:hypothetical protein